MPIEFLSGEPFEFWGWICGVLLARAHARTGDIAKIAGYIGKSDVFAAALATSPKPMVIKPNETMLRWSQRCSRAVSRRLMKRLDDGGKQSRF